jgi:hypothetical protein
MSKIGGNPLIQLVEQLDQWIAAKKFFNAKVSNFGTMLILTCSRVSYTVHMPI